MDPQSGPQDQGRALDIPGCHDAPVADRGRADVQRLRVAEACRSARALGSARFAGNHTSFPEDQAAADRPSASPDPADPRRIEPHVLPEPFPGYHDAPVLVLTTSP